jgi:hypothetical protein
VLSWGMQCCPGVCSAVLGYAVLSWDVQGCVVLSWVQCSAGVCRAVSGHAVLICHALLWPVLLFSCPLLPCSCSALC